MIPNSLRLLCWNMVMKKILNFQIERDWDLIQTIVEEDPDNYGKLHVSIQIIPCLVELIETKYPSQLSKIPVSYLRKK